MYAGLFLCVCTICAHLELLCVPVYVRIVFNHHYHIQPPPAHATATTTICNNHYHIQGQGNRSGHSGHGRSKGLGQKPFLQLKASFLPFAENVPLLVQQIKLNSVVSSVCSVLLIITSVTLLSTIVSKSTL